MTVDGIRKNLERIRQELPTGVELLAATKYIPPNELPLLAEAGITLIGENRIQDLEAKQELYGDLFTWDFIGAVQSRKLKRISPRVRLIHSISSESALNALHSAPAGEVLIQVNLATEASKQGIQPEQLPEYLERCPSPVTGLMTMPPAVTNPEQNRPYFARLAELAAEHGLKRLSMGTSQDYKIAAQEGATTVRLGQILYAES